MTPRERLLLRLDIWMQALKRLSEAVAEASANPASSTLRDGVIQRFEFCFELTWKGLKAALEHDGFSGAVSPRATMKLAYQAGWLADEPDWLNMLDDRNQTSHSYDEATALAIYSRIVSHHLPLMQSLYRRLAADRS